MMRSHFAGNAVRMTDRSSASRPALARAKERFADDRQAACGDMRSGCGSSRAAITSVIFAAALACAASRLRDRRCCRFNRRTPSPRRSPPPHRPAIPRVTASATCDKARAAWCATTGRYFTTGIGFSGTARGARPHAAAKLAPAGAGKSSSGAAPRHPRTVATLSFWPTPPTPRRHAWPPNSPRRCRATVCISRPSPAKPRSLRWTRPSAAMPPISPSCRWTRSAIPAAKGRTRSPAGAPARPISPGSPTNRSL